AAAGWPQERQELALAHLQGDGVDRGQGPKSFGHGVQLYVVGPVAVRDSHACPTPLVATVLGHDRAKRRRRSITWAGYSTLAPYPGGVRMCREGAQRGTWSPYPVARRPHGP